MGQAESKSLFEQNTLLKQEITHHRQLQQVAISELSNSSRLHEKALDQLADNLKVHEKALDHIGQSLEMHRNALKQMNRTKSAKVVDLDEDEGVGLAFLASSLDASFHCTLCCEVQNSIVRCPTCHQVIGCHDCVERWLKSGRSNNCPLCRAKWPSRRNAQK